MKRLGGGFGGGGPSNELREELKKLDKNIKKILLYNRREKLKKIVKTSYTRPSYSLGLY
jgi:hypothetical protein